MFWTHESERGDLPALVLPEGGASWAVVRLAVHAPWYILGYSDIWGGEEAPRETMLVGRLATLEGILTEGNRFDFSVEVVTPGYVNGSDGWSVDRVSQIWRQERREIYELADGRRLGWPQPLSGGPLEEGAQKVFDAQG